MDLFGLDKPNEAREGMALLTTVNDNGELAALRGLLEGADIPYMIKERGAGSSVRIILGFSIFGTDIFVPETRLEEALALITPPDEISDADGAPDSEEK